MPVTWPTYQSWIPRPRGACLIQHATQAIAFEWKPVLKCVRTPFLENTQYFEKEMEGRRQFLKTESTNLRIDAVTHALLKISGHATATETLKLCI